MAKIPGTESSSDEGVKQEKTSIEYASIGKVRQQRALEARKKQCNPTYSSQEEIKSMSHTHRVPQKTDSVVQQAKPSREKETNPVFHDQGEFEKVLPSIRSKLAVYLKGRGCPSADIEDLAEAVVVKLKYEKTPVERGQSTYLYTAARRRFIDYLRAQERRISTVSIELFRES